MRPLTTRDVTEEITLETNTGRHANEIDKNTVRSAVFVRIFAFANSKTVILTAIVERCFVIFSQLEVLTGTLLQAS